MVDALSLVLVMVILLAGVRKLNLGVLLLFSALLLGLIERTPLVQIFAAFFRGAFGLPTLSLVTVLVLIMVLEYIMQAGEILPRMINSMQQVIRDRRVLTALFPALIGILPSVGGAVFSAPLVEQAAADTGLVAEKKAFINFWFRHGWEFFSPLYPAVIFASGILKIPINTIMLYHLPLGIALWLTGIAFAFHTTPAITIETGNVQEREQSVWAADIAAGVLPFAAVLLAVALFDVPLIPALVATIAVLLLLKRPGNLEAKEMLARSVVPGTLALVVGLMVFQEVLKTTGAAARLPGLLSQTGVPLVVVLGLVPFVVGFVSGSIGGTVAIVMPVLGSSICGNMALEMWSYSCCVAGCMLTPTHPCLALTVDYFGSDMVRTLRRLLLPVATLVAAAAAWCFVAGKF